MPSKPTAKATAKSGKPAASARTATETTAVADTGVSYVELMDQAGDAMIQSLVETQDATLAAIKAAVEDATRPIEYPTYVAPVFPTLREVVESNLAFADKYLANQKEYADKVLELHGV